VLFSSPLEILEAFARNRGDGQKERRYSEVDLLVHPRLTPQAKLRDSISNRQLRSFSQMDPDGQKLWRARSRLYQRRCLQSNTHFAAL